MLVSFPYLVPAPPGVSEDIDDWTPATQASVETIVTSSRVVVVLDNTVYYCRYHGSGVDPVIIADLCPHFIADGSSKSVHQIVVE